MALPTGLAGANEATATAAVRSQETSFHGCRGPFIWNAQTGDLFSGRPFGARPAAKMWSGDCFATASSSFPSKAAKYWANAGIAKTIGPT